MSVDTSKMSAEAYKAFTESQATGTKPPSMADDLVDFIAAKPRNEQMVEALIRADREVWEKTLFKKVYVPELDAKPAANVCESDKFAYGRAEPATDPRQGLLNELSRFVAAVARSNPDTKNGSGLRIMVRDMTKEAKSLKEKIEAFETGNATSERSKA